MKLLNFLEKIKKKILKKKDVKVIEILGENNVDTTNFFQYLVND